jgi:hypothetical protein
VEGLPGEAPGSEDDGGAHDTIMRTRKRTKRARFRHRAPAGSVPARRTVSGWILS